jgi:hypothetical protein
MYDTYYAYSNQAVEDLLLQLPTVTTASMRHSSVAAFAVELLRRRLLTITLIIQSSLHRVRSNSRGS